MQHVRGLTFKKILQIHIHTYPHLQYLPHLQDYEAQVHSLRQHNLVVEKTLQIRQSELSEAQESSRALQQQTSVIKRQVRPPLPAQEVSPPSCSNRPQ